MPDAVINAYAERISHFRKAKSYLQEKNVPKGVEFLQKYLLSVAAYWSVTEKTLNPELFKDEGHISEQLLISYAYWDLAKAFDQSEKFTDETLRCLKQFVLFSIGFKYQYSNSLMIRKYIRLNKARNKKAFQQAYEKIYLKVKGCFMVSFAYSEDHPIVEEFRNFRDQNLLKNSFGAKLICFYYSVSPKVVSFLQSLRYHQYIRVFILRPFLFILYLIIKCWRKLFYVF